MFRIPRLPHKSSFDENYEQSHDQKEVRKIKDKSIDCRKSAILFDPPSAEIRIGLVVIRVRSEFSVTVILDAEIAIQRRRIDDGGRCDDYACKI